jgi:hypothetical protein
MYFDQPLALVLYATTTSTTRFGGTFILCFSGGFLKNILFLAYFYVLIASLHIIQQIEIPFLSQL